MRRQEAVWGGGGGGGACVQVDRCWIRMQGPAMQRRMTRQRCSAGSLGQRSAVDTNLLAAAALYALDGMLAQRALGLPPRAAPLLQACQAAGWDSASREAVVWRRQRVCGGGSSGGGWQRAPLQVCWLPFRRLHFTVPIPHQNSWPHEQPCTVAGCSGGLWRQMTHRRCSAAILRLFAPAGAAVAPAPLSASPPRCRCASKPLAQPIVP